jgi:hypothetical protein
LVRGLRGGIYRLRRGEVFLREEQLKEPQLGTCSVFRELKKRQAHGPWLRKDNRVRQDPSTLTVDLIDQRIGDFHGISIVIGKVQCLDHLGQAGTESLGSSTEFRHNRLRLPAPGNRERHGGLSGSFSSTEMRPKTGVKRLGRRVKDGTHFGRSEIAVCSLTGGVQRISRKPRCPGRSWDD